MKLLVSIIRRYLASGLLRGLFVSAAAYSLYLAYVGAIYAIVPDGYRDPIYRLTGIPRTEQFVGASVAFAVVAMVLLIRHFAHTGRPLDFASSAATSRGTTLLVALLFLNGVAASLAAILDELNNQFWTPLFAWIAVVLALQVLIVYAVLSRIRRPRTHLALMAALGVLNLFALYLSILGEFQGQPVIIRAGIIVLASLCFGALFAAVGKRIVPVRSVNVVLLIAMSGPIAGILFSPSPAPDIAGHMSSFDGIEFHTKPNIHIVSIDALSPASLAKKNMGLSDLPYVRLLEHDGVTVFKNAFASQVPTRQSLNSLMRLAHPDFAGDFGYFAGRTDGPVTHVLHANGYHIATGFDQYYFGDQGPFVDSYVPEPTRAIRNSTLCALALDIPLKFFGFCSLGFLFDGPRPSDAWPDRVIDIIRRSDNVPASMPRFTLHYIYNPIGHTALDYRSSDREALKRYAALYREGAAKVAGIMTRIYETVRNDPAPSMLIVMGDHGPFLSRTVSPDDDLTFVVQDQHGILAAILVNDTGCTTQHLQHYTAEFATPERILAGLMRCLAYDPTRVDSAMKFDEAYLFKNFVYE